MGIGISFLGKKISRYVKKRKIYLSTGLLKIIIFLIYNTMNFANFVQITHESAVGFLQINVTHVQNFARISRSL